jgi:uncharacterized protein (DUF885 family)
MLDMGAEEIERIGWQLIADTERDLDELVTRLGGSRPRMQVLEDLRKQHPQTGELLQAYKRAMAASREFIVDHNLVSLPENEHLEVVDTPAFQRPMIPFAAYVSPGPFEASQEGIFWVTPVDHKLPDKELETRLRGHPYGKIPVTAVHEGYPGHHLQLVRGNQAATLARKVAVVSSLFVEGWAFYCEEMMEQQGFLTDPAGRVFRLADQLWRACRIVIDVGLHTGRMTIGEAVEMLVQRAGLERPDAEAEVRRYTMTPTQPMCYLIGKLEIMKIAEEYRNRRAPGFDIKAFHDQLLSHGSMTPKLIRRKLFGGPA